MLTGRHVTGLQEAIAVLNCRRLPGRLNSAETALLLGFQEHDVTVLVGARLLVPLGKPAANAPKYFAAVDIEACAKDPEWLGQATRALAKYWLGKNQRKGKLRKILDAEELRAA